MFRVGHRLRSSLLGNWLLATVEPTMQDAMRPKGAPALPKMDGTYGTRIQITSTWRKHFTSIERRLGRIRNPQDTHEMEWCRGTELHPALLIEFQIKIAA